MHGEPREINKLLEGLRSQYRITSDAGAGAGLGRTPPTYRINIQAPQNAQSVSIQLRGERLAKVVGRLAEPPLKQRLLAAYSSDPDVRDDERHADDGEAAVAGVLVRRHMNLHLMDPRDLSSIFVFNIQITNYK